MSESLHDLNFSDLAEKLTQAGVKPVHTKALWCALQHRSHTREQILASTDFAPPLRQWLAQLVRNSSPEQLFDQPEIAELIPSTDGLTHKFLFRLQDGQEVESVLMSYDGRHTACLSTQAGCAMGCVFCATGQRGFSRHLRTGEIIAQIHHLRRFLAENFPGRPRLRNLVLMGMGEPLHNYDHVLKAMHIASDTRGINIGPSRIAISTVGLVPQILRLAEENQPFRLAVSLHGSTEEQRAALIPVSKRYPLHALVDACRHYQTHTGKRILFGWTLIEGQNDTPAQAHSLAQLLVGLDAHINLIPLNPTDGYAGTSATNQHSLEFQKILRSYGFPCTFRQRRGIDVAAGCGQLKAKSEKTNGKNPPA